MMSVDDINELCREIAEETLAQRVDEYIAQLEEDELDRMMLAMGPRAFGPDADDDYAVS